MARGNRVKNRAQSVSEYSVFLAIVLVAIIFMNVYVKRGLQGRQKDMVAMPAQQISSVAKTAGNTPDGYVVYEQYEPYYLQTDTTVNVPKKSIDQTVTSGGKVKRDILSEKPITVTGTNIEGANVD
ncbi:MAG: hypothetical protein WC301_06550 [Candidatus Omnitrophota bacterium]|jgi:uncharacterized protein (UPF0333 family)